MRAGLGQRGLAADGAAQRCRPISTALLPHCTPHHCHAPPAAPPPPRCGTSRRPPVRPGRRRPTASPGPAHQSRTRWRRRRRRKPGCYRPTGRAPPAAPAAAGPRPRGRRPWAPGSRRACRHPPWPPPARAQPPAPWRAAACSGLRPGCWPCQWPGGREGRGVGWGGRRPVSGQQQRVRWVGFRLLAPGWDASGTCQRLAGAAAHSQRARTHLQEGSLDPLILGGRQAGGALQQARSRDDLLQLRRRHRHLHAPAPAARHLARARRRLQRQVGCRARQRQVGGQRVFALRLVPGVRWQGAGPSGAGRGVRVSTGGGPHTRGRTHPPEEDGAPTTLDRSAPGPPPHLERCCCSTSFSRRTMSRSQRKPPDRLSPRRPE